MIITRTRFLNFKPTDGFQLYTDAILNRLLDIAPSDSSTSSWISKIGGKYSCRIQINSGTRKFDSLILEALNPISALEEARRKIIEQIANWRSQRFAMA